MNRLLGKAALVTGAARGIGAAIARRFIDEGARVALTDIDAERVTATASDLGAWAVPADVSDSVQVQALFAAIDQRFGGLDVLVNNAGIMGFEAEPAKLASQLERGRALEEEARAGKPLTAHLDATLETTDTEWRRMLAVHLDGTFYCTRAALRLMMRKNTGVIINIGSVMATAGGGGAVAYGAAKAGILGLTRCVARDVVTRGIRVNAIAPGWIETDMTALLEEARGSIEAATPMRRMGEPDDVAWAAVYLASDESKFVTGQVLSPNGGFYMSQ